MSWITSHVCGVVLRGDGTFFFCSLSIVAIEHQEIDNKKGIKAATCHARTEPTVCRTNAEESPGNKGRTRHSREPNLAEHEIQEGVMQASGTRPKEQPLIDCVCW